MPQTPMEAQATELDACRLFIRIQHDALREKLAGLSDDDATATPTASAFCMLTLAKHAAFVERRWLRAVGGLDLEGYWPPRDPGEELRIDPGDDVASILALLDDVGAATTDILAGSVDLDTVNELGLNGRWILFHVVEELARHAGHADLIRESIDGTAGV